MEEEIMIDIGNLIQQFIKKIWFIVLITLIGGGAMYYYSTEVEVPMYQANVKLYVNNSTFSLGSTSYSISSGELSAAQSLIQTYIVILETRTAINEIIEKGNYDYTYEEMVSMINASAVNNTEVFSVQITNPSAKEASSIANTIGEVLPSCISNVVDGSDVRIVDYAVEPVTQVSPVVSKSTLTGCMMGFVVAVVLIGMQIVMDNVIHSETFLEQAIEYPILSIIPKGETKNYAYSRRLNNE